MGDVRKTLEVVKRHTNGLDSMKEQLREFELESLDSSVDVMKGALSSTIEKLTARDDAFNGMVTALHEPNRASIRIGSIVHSIKAKRIGESEKKLVE
ncbi:hypothetical protein J1N35_025215 [Gossypium stocksii]|uniref:Uncharacterized protein n=1 Tax=Gossypium stocksii TaxID=47602 RepID=A0A9D3ZWY1_9ROSI|nr:hypothetical protein J1N35_025215 [Gossypium stocksii]